MLIVCMLYMAPIWLLMQQPLTAVEEQKLRSMIDAKNSIDVLDMKCSYKSNGRVESTSTHFKCEWTPTPFVFICSQWMPFKATEFHAHCQNHSMSPPNIARAPFRCTFKRTNNYYFFAFLFLFCTQHSFPCCSLEPDWIQPRALFECSYFDRKTFIHSDRIDTIEDGKCFGLDL